MKTLFYIFGVFGATLCFTTRLKAFQSFTLPSDTLIQTLVPVPAKDSIVSMRLPRFELSMNLEYMSQVVFSGRDYGIRQFAQIPSVSIKHRSGWWVGTVGYYFSGVSQPNSFPISKQDFVIGYQRQISSRWSASISYSRWQYYGKSQAELKYTFDDFISNYNMLNCQYFSLSPQLYAMIGNHNQNKVLQFGLGVSKYFEKRFSTMPHTTWSIEPSYVCMSSTLGADGSDGPPAWFEGKKVQIVSHEFLLPMSYRRDLKWGQANYGCIILTPTWHGALAVNARPQDGARKAPIGYWTINFRYIYQKY